jgi:signal transduction histidine kinase
MVDTMASRKAIGFNPLRALWSGKAWRAALYCLLSLPIGILYANTVQAFWNLTPLNEPSGLFPLFLLLLAGGWILTRIERWLVVWLLDAKLTPTGPLLPPDASPWERIKAHFRNPVTWKSLVYLAARIFPALPLGLLALWVFTLALELILAPVFALISNFYLLDPWFAGVENVLGWYVYGYRGIEGFVQQLHNGPIVNIVAAPFLGILLLVVELWLFQGWGYAWAQFARQLLGINPLSMQLAETRVALTDASGRAERSDAARRQLILDASHELRTPVATVRAYLDSLLLLEGERLDETLRRYLGMMQGEVERLGALVDDLLTLARTDADTLRLDVRPIGAGAVVELVYQTMAPLAERERQVKLVRELPGDETPQVYADSARLTQALMNLVRNAITHTPTGGLVSIALAFGSDPNTMTITVSDTGAGISDEDLPHIFERFYRADAARARDTGGFGLGLSIVRDMIEAMGGSVGAGNGPEGGAQFQITLRAVPATAAWWGPEQ